MGFHNGIRRSAFVGFAVSLAVLARSESAAAQIPTVSQESKVYAGAAFEVSSQDGGPRDVTDPDQPNARVGGSALGFAGTIGYRLTPLVSLAAEVSVPSRFKSLQQIDYFEDSRSELHHRDAIVSALIHLHIPSAGPLRPAFVAGISYVREDTLTRTATAPGFGSGAGVFGPYSNEQSIERDTFGLTVGADVGISLGEHVDLVPQLRAHWISRADFGQANGILYLSPLVIRGGIGLRIRF